MFLLSSKGFKHRIFLPSGHLCHDTLQLSHTTQTRIFFKPVSEMGSVYCHDWDHALMPPFADLFPWFEWRAKLVSIWEKVNLYQSFRSEIMNGRNTVFDPNTHLSWISNLSKAQFSYSDDVIGFRSMYQDFNQSEIISLIIQSEVSTSRTMKSTKVKS